MLPENNPDTSLAGININDLGDLPKGAGFVKIEPWAPGTITTETDFAKQYAEAKLTRPPVNYIFNEQDILKDVLEYIKTTYSAHYTGDDEAVQFTEYFLKRKPDKKEVVGAFRFNSQKYIDRYGFKNGYDKKDIYKAIHYLAMLLYTVDKYNLNEENNTK